LLGSEKSDAIDRCDSVEERDAVGVPYAMGEEHFNILICRGLKTPLPILWEDLKHWN